MASGSKGRQSIRSDANDAKPQIIAGGQSTATELYSTPIGRQKRVGDPETTTTFEWKESSTRQWPDLDSRGLAFHDGDGTLSRILARSFVGEESFEAVFNRKNQKVRLYNSASKIAQQDADLALQRYRFMTGEKAKKNALADHELRSNHALRYKQLADGTKKGIDKILLDRILYQKNVLPSRPQSPVPESKSHKQGRKAPIQEQRAKSPPSPKMITMMGRAHALALADYDTIKLGGSRSRGRSPGADEDDFVNPKRQFAIIRNQKQRKLANLMKQSGPSR